MYNYSMVQKIITVPDPILRQKAKPVVRVDKKIKNLVRDLKDTLKAADNPKGIGLSAPQVGVSKQVMIIKLGGKIIPIINPQITYISKQTLFQTLEKEKRFLEGCLSVPGYWGYVDRSYKIKTKYQDLSGNQVEEEYEGKQAALFQHEYDHLEGVLFIDRVLQQKGKIYKIEKNEKGEEELVEIKLM